MSTDIKTNQKVLELNQNMSELDILEHKSDEALSVLNSRQRRFVEVLVTGVSQAEAARQAGYAVKSARIKASRLMTLGNILLAVQSLRKVQALKHGRPQSWKRKELEGLLQLAKQQENVTAGDKVLRSMMELDGDIRKNNGGGSHTTIQIIGLDRQAGITIEHDDSTNLVSCDKPI